MSYGLGAGLPGLLSTASGLLFGADANGNLVARDSTNGRPLWHTRLGAITNAPQTYLVDGRQYVLIASDDRLYAFALNSR